MVKNNFTNRFQKSASCYYKVVTFFMVWIAILPAVHAQQEVSYAVHANIIYRFTKYIEWPDYYNSAAFVIGIVGETPMYDELESFIVNKTVGKKKIVVKKMSALADFYNCQILFIAEDKSGSIKKIAAVTADNPVLIVSEAGARASRGSCINFIMVSDHLKLEINKTNIENRNLRIATELLRLGNIVK